MLDLYRDFPLSTNLFGSSFPFSGLRNYSMDSWEPKFWTVRDPDTKDVTIVGAVAGLNENDLKLEVTDNLLKISGTRRLPGQGEQSFEKSYELSKLDTTKVKATLKDGLLTVQLPVAEAAKPRQIKLITGD